MRKATSFISALVLGIAVVAPAAAQQGFPNKPIRFVVPFAAGGGGDITSRLVAQGMSKYLNQQVVVDNRPGAAGQVGIDLVAKSPADGYTVVFGSSGPLTVTPHFRPLPYDPLKDLAAVGMMATSDGVVVVAKDFPARTPREFIDLLKTSPNKYSFGSSGTGGPSHLSGERFQIATGTRLTHVGYKGDGPAMADLASGHIPIVFTLMASVMQHINAGTIRPIAAYGEKRSGLLPDLPTFVELGYKDLTYSSWFAMYAPAGTPKPVIDRLNAALKHALTDPDLATRLASLGIEPKYSTPEELADFTRAEHAKNGALIRERNIRLEQ